MTAHLTLAFVAVALLAAFLVVVLSAVGAFVAPTLDLLGGLL